MRLPSSLQPSVYAEIQDFLLSAKADKYGVSREERTRRVIAYDKSLAQARHDNNKTYPTLYTLPSMLKIANMTVVDIYRDLWGIEIRWPDKQSADVAAIIDKLSEDPKNHAFLNQLCLFIRSIIEPWWEENDEGKGKNTNPTTRIKNAYMKLVTLDERPTLPEDVQRVFKRLLITTCSASHLEIPRLCDVLHITFHWVIGYPADVLVLGKSQYTERFMDDFVRLAPSHRAMFENLINNTESFLESNSFNVAAMAAMKI